MWSGRSTQRWGNENDCELENASLGWSLSLIPNPSQGCHLRICTIASNESLRPTNCSNAFGLTKPTASNLRLEKNSSRFALDCCLVRSVHWRCSDKYWYNDFSVEYLRTYANIRVLVLSVFYRISWACIRSNFCKARTKHRQKLSSTKPSSEIFSAIPNSSRSHLHMAHHEFPRQLLHYNLFSRQHMLSSCLIMHTLTHRFSGNKHLWWPRSNTTVNWCRHHWQCAFRSTLAFLHSWTTVRINVQAALCCVSGFWSSHVVLF